MVECQPALKRLLATAPGVQAVVSGGDVRPEFSVQCPMLSLPLALDITPQTIPAEVPYLHADVAAVARWRERLAKLPQRLKVGIIWKGNPAHRNDGRRSMAPANFESLAEVASGHDIALMRLGKEDGPESQAQAAAGMKLIDWTTELFDFADTAALIENLDLVISVDTAVAHLAGALGKKVWLLIPSSGDWRWLVGREDSPWYPTMRIFRQKNLGDWAEPVGAVAVALKKLAQAQEAGGGS
jgi:hypothetical protein